MAVAQDCGRGLGRSSGSDLVSGTDGTAEAKARYQDALTVLAAMVVPLFLLVFYDVLFKTPPGFCHAGPDLTVLDGDGEVTLTWEPGDEQATVKHWRYQQSAQGENTVKMEDIVAAANSHVVSGLTNGVTYVFRVQGILDPHGFSCWSNPVLAVPGHLRNVVGRIERHQRAIVANGKALRKISRRGVRALEGLGKSASEIAVATAGTKRVVDRLAKDLAGIAAELGVDREPCREGESCSDPTPRPERPDACNGSPLGEILFKHRSYRIGDKNKSAVKEILAKLTQRKGGLVLTEGYATSVGFAKYNLHLSDLRAICVSDCLRSHLPNDRSFQFREIAKGEVPKDVDLPGKSDDSRRVDVTLCEAPVLPELSSKTQRRVGPSAEECGCPSELR